MARDGTESVLVGGKGLVGVVDWGCGGQDGELGWGGVRHD